MEGKLKARNLGSIDYAEIEIKPLTVLVGRNSTGKTFITKTIYSIVDALDRNLINDKISEILEEIKEVSPRLERKIKISSLNTSLIIDINLIIENLKRLYESLTEIKKTIEQNKTYYDEAIELLDKKNINVLCERIINTISKLKKLVKEDFKTGRTLRSFYFDFKILEKNLKKLLDISSEREYLKIFSIEIKNKMETNFLTNISSLVKFKEKNATIELKLDNNLEPLKLEILEDKIFVKNKIDLIKDINLLLNINNSFYLDSPVYIKIRNGLMLSPNYTPEYIIKFVNSFGKKKVALNLGDEEKRIIKNIRNIINGYIDLDDFGNLIFIENSKDKFRISISTTAMGKTNIGIIEWLFRYKYISTGSFLIIDEPEVHLHPSWQKKLIFVLYELAKYGVNVVIATHSIDIVYALESLMKCDKDAKDKIAINKLPFDNEFRNKSLKEKIEDIIEDLGEAFSETFFEVE